MVRKPRSEFQTTLTGRVYYQPATGEDYRGLQGVEVEISYSAETDPGGSRTVYATTGPDGSFTAEIRWRRDLDTYTGPPPETPEGEDVLTAGSNPDDDELVVTYTHSLITDSGNQERQQIRSWIDPERMEDLYLQEPDNATTS